MLDQQFGYVWIASGCRVNQSCVTLRKNNARTHARTWNRVNGREREFFSIYGWGMKKYTKAYKYQGKNTRTRVHKSTHGYTHARKYPAPTARVHTHAHIQPMIQVKYRTLNHGAVSKYADTNAAGNTV